MNHPELSKGQSSVEILDIIEETRVNGNFHQSVWSEFILFFFSKLNRNNL